MCSTLSQCCVYPLHAHRQWLVDYLFAVCEMLHISHGTRFLAVKLMDHFMDKHVVMDYHIKLVALTCLLVAGMLGSYIL